MNFVDVEGLIADYGVISVYCILFAIIFAESGLFFDGSVTTSLTTCCS